MSLRLPLLASLVVLGVALNAHAEDPASTKSPHAPRVPAAGAARPKPGAARRAPDADGALSADAAFASASSFYEAGQYVPCVEAFASLLGNPDSGLSPRAREQASVYYAACLIAVGRVDSADAQFREAIRVNPQMAVPSAVVFPPSVIERFVIVRSELIEEIRRSEEERAARERAAAELARKRAVAEQRRVVELEKLATEETVIDRSQRWVASVPFGVGQFQNRKYFLGSVFLAAETILVGTALTATGIELSLNAQAGGGAHLTNEAQVEQLNANLRTANRVALVSAGAFLLVAGGGILEANLSYVPEFRDGVRKRRLPRRLERPSSSFFVAPTVEAAPGGAEIGVFGRF